MDYITAVLLYLRNKASKWHALDKFWAEQYEKDYVIHHENPWEKSVSAYKAQEARMKI
ncbi:MAG: hypothetical protein WA139_02280 [Candidatus Aenigmatarchaeota archaeon]